MPPIREQGEPPPPVREMDEQTLVKGFSRKSEWLTVSQAARKSRMKTVFFKDLRTFGVISSVEEGRLGTKTGSRSCKYRKLKNSDSKRK